MLPKAHLLANKTSVSLEELQDEAMILLDLTISREYFTSIVQLSAIKPRIVERAADLSVVRSLVANGFGYSIVNMRTKSNFAPDGEEIVFLQLKNEVEPLAIGLATKQIDYLPLKNCLGIL